jgi:hypothetical protein
MNTNSWLTEYLIHLHHAYFLEFLLQVPSEFRTALRLYYQSEDASEPKERSSDQSDYKRRIDRLSYRQQVLHANQAA